MPSGSTPAWLPQSPLHHAWLVRGTYHVEGGLLKDGTGTLVAGYPFPPRSGRQSKTFRIW